MYLGDGVGSSYSEAVSGTLGRALGWCLSLIKRGSKVPQGKYLRHQAILGGGLE